MKDYEAPGIVELGSVSELTHGSGDERGWDSEYPGLWGFLGFIFGNGGSPSGSTG